LAATSVDVPNAARGRGRWPIVVAGVAAAVVVILVAATLIYDHSRRDVIAKGVTVDGIAVGGLKESAARTKLERDLVARLNEPVVVRSGDRHWVLAHGADVKVDLANMVDQAVRVSREGSILTRTFRSLSGGSVHHNVGLVATYSHQAVRGLTAQVRAAVNRAPRNATVEPGSRGLKRVPAQVGLTVDSTKLGGRIEAALIAPTGSRTVSVPTHKLKPAVTTSELAAKYPAYIVVNRGTFRLSFYKHLKLERTYEVAVGMEGLETPAGLHHIEWEQVDPPWYVPKKAWAGALAGTVVPPGPADPLKARFMSIEGGAGIHGIDPSEYSSIGHNASHGCVRMRIPDVISLYAKTPVGTPVFII
jgi:lipoprotein-anchoring transpeptidase ErfK/SrfK